MIEDGLYLNERGSKFWYKNGLQHREDGPAVIYCDGSKEWFYDSQIMDKPILIDISNQEEWWYEGEKLLITPKVIRELLEVVG